MIMIYLTSPKVGRMNIAKDVRRRARNSAQKPGAVQVIPDKRSKPVKHKKPIHDTD